MSYEYPALDKDPLDMTPGEVQAALDQYAKARGKQPQITRAESLEAITAAFKASATGRRLANPHPLAEAMLESGPVGLKHMVTAMSRVVGRPVNSYSPAELVALGASVPQFPEALIDTARAVLTARPNDTLTDVLAITADLRVSNYNAQAFGLVDIELGLPDAASGSHFLGVTPRFSAQHIQTFSTFGKLVLSLQGLADDDVNLLPSLVVAFAAAAARAEAKGIALLLEGNKLSNGSALFAAGNSNIGTATLTLGGLGTAASLLRKQPTETGEPSGAKLAGLLVHSDDEMAALALVESLPPASQPRVVANPHLSTSGYWFAFADPRSYPALGRVLMTGSDPSGISFGGMGPATWIDSGGQTRDFPGIALDATHTTGLASVSPIGIVRLSKT
jgi:hypothetical protein